MSGFNAAHAALDTPAAAELLAPCAPIADAFSVAGFRLYLVGGSVRDLVDGHSVSEPDLDFTTNARPSDTKALLKPIAEALWTQGERFGTIAAHIDGRLVEVTTHRAEAYEPQSRKPIVAFSDDVVTDLSRRDFTINALAIEVTADQPELLDPYGGVEDLRQRRLATPLAPSESFSDDPLRMMRAARFLARFDLNADPELISAVRSMAERLDVVSVERVRDEFDKLLVLTDPRRGLQFLIDNGLAARFIAPMTSGVVDRVDFELLPADADLRLAAILSAAPETVDVAEILRALKSSRQSIAMVSGVVDIVRRLVDRGPSAWSDAEVRRFVHRRLPLVNAALGVAAAVGVEREAASLISALEALAERDDVTKLTVPLGGRDVMELLGAEAGPLIGDAMDALIAHRLEVGPINAEAAREFLRAWNAQR